MAALFIRGFKKKTVVTIGIIGGSGLYEIESLENIEEIQIETPFGSTSSPLVKGTLHGKPVIFLGRHGKGHRLLPAEVPYKANIWAFKKLGVSHVLSVSAVGSLRQEIAPGHFVFPDQFIDKTLHRPSTFFGKGVVAHVQFGRPVCKDLLSALSSAARTLGIQAHNGGVYVCMEGPAFSSRAESLMHQGWGGSVIGMTNVQEARLAREAQMCFATIALVTDYDSWHEAESEEVSVEAIMALMAQNIQSSKILLARVIQDLPADQHCRYANALQHAIITPPADIPTQIKKDLAPILAEYLQSNPSSN